MDRTTAQSWLDRYVEAWKSYDPDAIGALFADDATYRFHPYDEGDDVVRGRAQILEAWLNPDGNASDRDAPGTYDGHYEPWAIDDDRVVATGWSKYWTDGTRSKVAQTYDNVYLIRFDGDGRCVEFTEYFMKEPDPAI